MMYVTGQIYQDGAFKDGYLGVEEGLITEFGEGIRENALKKGIIIPTLINAHTHIGDAVIQNEVKGGLEEVVAPPDGLKHRILRETPEEDMLDSMKHVAKKMLLSGITHFCDFREGGLEGVNILKNALSDSPLSSKVFGRPKGLKYVKEEIEEILKVADGIGLSAVSDWPEDDIRKVASHTKSQKKSFALHASERTREDIDFILDLKPDFLIHMNKAKESDLKLCTESNVPIILCPRSEVFFGHIPNIPLMIKSNVTLALGTDNAMLNSLVLINSRKVLNVKEDICLTQGKQASFIVFELSKTDPAYTLVNGARAGDISMICVNDYLWVKK
jgi:cytosine/adenosine deaminase-related metal-dependent hydrolase